MKRIISIKSVSLCLLMCMAAFSFAGCSSEDEDKPGGNNVKIASEDNTEETDTEAGEYQQGDIEYTSGDKWELYDTYADTRMFGDPENREQCHITVTATETTYLKKLEKEYIASMEDTYGTDYVSANKKFGEFSYDVYSYTGKNKKDTRYGYDIYIHIDENRVIYIENVYDISREKASGDVFELLNTVRTVAEDTQAASEE